jgi:heme-degrading monooxygenase HmoA
MFAVIFEVQPKPERRDDYLSLAKMLRPELNTIDGFLSIERFACRRRPDWILSLSFWRDEAAIVRWRTHELHHEVQEKGRFEVFRDYRLRVSQVVIDDSPEKPAWRPERRSAYNDLQAHPPTFAAVLEVEPAAKGQADQINLTAVVGAEVERSTGFLGSERFDSIYVEGKFAYLTSWRDESSAMAWRDRVAAHLASRAVTAGPRATFRLRVTEVERDYGMFSRAEAPQYYAPVERSD